MAKAKTPKAPKFIPMKMFKVPKLKTFKPTKLSIFPLKKVKKSRRKGY